MEHFRDHASEAPEFDQDSVPALEAVQPPQTRGWQQQQQQQKQQPAPHIFESPEETVSRKPRRIAGLPVWAFWLLIGMIALAVICASVGGALGVKDSKATSP